jgi:hypothetical protein
LTVINGSNETILTNTEKASNDFMSFYEITLFIWVTGLISEEFRQVNIQLRYCQNFTSKLINFFFSFFFNVVQAKISSKKFLNISWINGIF